MKQTQNCIVTVLALLVLGMTAQAQDASTRTQDAPTRATARETGPAVTISVTERGVRFAAMGSFGKMRLEVFNADGTSLYNSDFAAASMRDWVLDNKDGQLLPDGTYLCVITIRDLSGRMSTKQGSVVLQGGQPSLKLPDGESVEVVEPDKSLARVTDPPDTALTLIGHDGKNGQVVSTRGALTFRFGDFFSAKDKELMRLTPEGNLGVGISKPEFKLDVAGAIRAREGFIFNDGSSLNVNDKGALTLTSSSNGNGTVTLTSGGGTVTPSTVTGSGTQNKLPKWNDNSGALVDSVITELSGNIGIGTTTPNAKLHIFADSNSAIRALFEGGSPEFWYKRTNSVTLPDGLFRYTIGPDGSFYLQRNTAIGGDFATVANPIIITKTDNTIFSGNVGIGTINPQSPLDVIGNLNVSGNATISGNIAAKYQDLAEWTSARTRLSPGTVVIVDTLKPNTVMASHKAYDTRVAGVVSSQPGVILGEGGPNKLQVATTGRVKVRVNANRCPIHIGDLLVTSNVPGMAMKSQPFRVRGQIMHRPGTIIGKALESLDKGEGTILVLLSLQ